jgi:hypothetical protein
MTSGKLLGEPPDAPFRERLTRLAATLPELYGTLDPRCLAGLDETDDDAAGGLGELVLMSGEYVHLIQPLSNPPGVALLAIGSALGNIGLLVAEFRASVTVAESG